MTSISTATASAQQYLSPPQPFQKADSNKANTGAATSPAPSTAQQPVSESAAKVVLESKTTKNIDGTYGPKHTLLSPAISNKPASSAGAVGVNVKI